jgi:hypothetical protein
MDTAIEKTDQNCVAAEGLLRWKQTAANGSEMVSQQRNCTKACRGRKRRRKTIVNYRKPPVRRRKHADVTETLSKKRVAARVGVGLVSETDFFELGVACTIHIPLDFFY